jgi:ankyrin repeat protein
MQVATPLKEACTRGDLEIARVLLEAGADPNLVTDAWTPLMEAARLGNREMIQLLVEFGADPNTTNEENWTALMAASNNGRTEAVDQLVQFGADPNMQDYVGWSAPLASVFKQHEEIALRLTEAGANPHLQNMEYRSPLRLAIEFKLYPVVDAFLDRHPDVKPGLRGHPELDSKDKVSQHSFVQRKEHFPPNSYV